jgi:DNA-binding NarL/FixJ family response regulator
MTRVLLADDHQLLRQAIRRTLEDAGIDVVGEASDGEEAVRMVGELTPDITVMDVTMPNMDGLTALEHVHANHPDAKVMMLTMHGEPDVVNKAVQHGAVGFLTKDTEMDRLVEAINNIASGEVLLSPELAAEMLKEFNHPTVAGSPEATTAPPATSPLTKREVEILQKVADGNSTTQVAEELFISAKTVKNHLASIYEKLDARDRTQAVLSGVRIGIITLR